MKFLLVLLFLLTINSSFSQGDGAYITKEKNSSANDESYQRAKDSKWIFNDHKNFSVIVNRVEEGICYGSSPIPDLQIDADTQGFTRDCSLLLSLKDNYSQFCKCTKQKIDTFQIPVNQIENAIKIKNDMYSKMGEAWLTKVHEVVNVLAVQNISDSDIPAFSCNSLNFNKPDILNQFLSGLGCAQTATDKKELNERLMIFLNGAMRNKQLAECKFEDLSENLKCFGSRVQSAHDKEVNDDYVSSNGNMKCYSNKELHKLSSLPELEEAITVTNIFKEGKNKELLEGDLLEKLQSFTTDELNSFIASSQMPLEIKKEIENFQNLLKKNPKIYHLLKNLSTKDQVLKDLSAQAELMTSISSLLAKPSLTYAEKQQLKVAAESYVILEGNFKTNKLYKPVIAGVLENSCQSNDNAGFSQEFRQMICTKPQNYSMPPRDIVEMIHSKDSKIRDGSFCLKNIINDFNDTQTSNLGASVKNISNAPSTSCLSPDYEFNFCDEKAIDALA